MGGHAGGEVASAMVVDELSEHAGEATLENLKEAARVGNRAIFEKAGNDVELHGMGTTLCALQVVPGPEGDELAWINVGDSRVYLFRDDSLIQLSRDHSLVEDLLRDGQLTADEAAVHPKRNIITRALGIDVDVDVDGSTVIPFNGDRYILCSDGLFGEVSEDVISSVLRRLEDPTDAADELVRLANEAGGRDNITVVIVEVTDDDGRAAAASAALAASASTLESADEPDSTTGDGDEASESDAAGDIEVVETPETIEPSAYVPVFADSRSSLPDPDEDLESAMGDAYAGMDGQRTRRITWRVLMFLVALLAVGAVVVGAILFSARNTYYVGFEGENVAVYKGKPSGVLWIEPELSQETSITRDELPEDLRATVEDNQQFGSESDATNFIVNLQSIVSDANPTTTTTTTPTTTTAPAPTTAPPPAPPTTAAP